MVAKKYQDYLFYRWPEGDNDSLLDCLERGVTSRPAVLSNSVNIADGANTLRLRKGNWRRPVAAAAGEGLHRQAVASLEEVETIIAAANGGEQLSQESGDEEPKRQLTAVFRMADSTSEGYSCECLGRQCTWYFLDNACLVPEFLVELEYSGRRTSNPFHQVVCGGGPAAPTPDLEPAPPVTAPYENLAELQIEALGLTRLRGLDSLHSLRTLNARSNLLTGLEDLAGLPVEEIDVSWNRIVSIDGLKHVGKLRSLRLAFNRLTCLRNELSHMRKHTAMLTGLSLEGNPWHRYKVAYRVIVINKLKELKVLDGQPVTEEEVTASMPGRFNLLSYAAHVTGTPKYISLESPTQFLPVQPPELFAQVSMLNLDGLNLTRITGLERCFNLRWLSINYNHVSRIEGLDSCSQLEELLATHNLIGTMPTGTYPALRHLNLAHNCIEQIGTGLLAPNLTSLNLLNNHVSSLAGIDKHSSLAQLFIGLNRIQDTRELFYLKSLQSLLILDLGENPIASNSHNYRTTVIYHLRSLCSLDGVPVEQDEVQSAVQLLGGKLTTDLLIEKFGHDRFYDLKELDINLRTIELNLHDRFINLRSVNLESNSLTTLNGIASLPSLRVLCLNHNHIESLASGTGSLLPTLEVLHLAYNGIKDAASLQLHRLPSLRTLFMQGNELQTTDGLQSGQLRELVLDRNKLRTINLSGCPYVQELHVEENRLKDLGGIPDHCPYLHTLYISANKLAELAELDRLHSLTRLQSLTLLGNPLARRLLHRPICIEYEEQELEDDPEVYRQFVTLVDGVVGSLALLQADMDNFLYFKDELMQQLLPPNLLLQLSLISGKLFRSYSDLQFPLWELLRLVRVYSSPWEEKKAALQKMHEDYARKEKPAGDRASTSDYAGRGGRERRIMNWEKLFARVQMARGHGRRWKFRMHDFKKRAAMGVEHLGKYFAEDQSDLESDVEPSEVGEDAEVEVDEADREAGEADESPADEAAQRENTEEKTAAAVEQLYQEATDVKSVSVSTTYTIIGSNAVVRTIIILSNSQMPAEIALPVETADAEVWTHEPEFGRRLHVRVYPAKQVKAKQVSVEVEFDDGGDEEPACHQLEVQDVLVPAADEKRRMPRRRQGAAADENGSGAGGAAAAAAAFQEVSFLVPDGVAPEHGGPQLRINVQNERMDRVGSVVLSLRQLVDADLLTLDVGADDSAAGNEDELERRRRTLEELGPIEYPMLLNDIEAGQLPMLQQQQQPPKKPGIRVPPRPQRPKKNFMVGRPLPAWGEDLPEDFFERMELLNHLTREHKARLVAQIRAEIAREVEAQLMELSRLAAGYDDDEDEQGEAGEAGEDRRQLSSADEVTIPALFMPQRGERKVYNPRAHLYFQPHGIKGARLTQPPSMLSLPPLP
uniref:Protein phosphatase 1 regulatory subunit 22 n=1 Tax=Macrostomum lignano TaxID=282301 RepID=A0A1I8GH90_9PLAT